MLTFPRLIDFINVTIKRIFRIKLIGFILLGAALLRIIFLVQHFENNPTWDTPVVDAFYHDQWAQEISAGDIWGDGPFFRAPLYPYILAAIYAVFGHNYLMPRLMQLLLGLLSIFMVYRIGQKLFSERTGHLAAGMMALYGLFVFFEGELLLDSFALFLNLVVIWWLITIPPASSAWKWLAAGALVGLAALARPNILIFIPVVVFWIFVPKPRLAQKGRKASLFLLGTLLLIAPVTLRNYLVGQDWVLISSQGGVNFYIGNNAEADGFSATFPGLGSNWDYADVTFLARQATNKNLKPSEISRFYFKKGLKFITTQPFDFLKLIARKLYLLFNATEISNNLDYHFARRFTPVLNWLPLNFGITGPLLFLGLLLMRRREIPVNRETGLMLGFVIAYSVSLLAFFITARFRLVLLPFFLIISAAALDWLLSHLQQKRFNVLIQVFIFLIAAAWLINSKWVGQNRKSVLAESYVRIGNCFLRNGQEHRAVLEFSRALSIDSTQALANLNKGVIYFKLGNSELAEAAFRREMQINPQEPRAYDNLSVLYRNQQKFSRAQKYAREAIQLRPNLVSAHYNLALALDAAGFRARALQALDSALKLPLAEFARINYLKGQLHQSAGDLEQARICYSQVISEKSESSLASTINLSRMMNQNLASNLSLDHLQAKAWYNLGIISLQENKIAVARQNFEMATRLNPKLHEAWENLGLIYDAEKNHIRALALLQQAVNLAPENAVYHFNLGLVWAKLGKFKETKSAFETALRLNPDFRAAREKLAVVERIMGGT